MNNRFVDHDVEQLFIEFTNYIYFIFKRRNEGIYFVSFIHHFFFLML